MQTTLYCITYKLGNCIMTANNSDHICTLHKSSIDISATFIKVVNNPSLSTVTTTASCYLVLDIAISLQTSLHEVFLIFKLVPFASLSVFYIKSHLCIIRLSQGDCACSHCVLVSILPLNIFKI